MLKKVIKHAERIAKSENGGCVLLEEEGIYAVYDNHRILFTREDTGVLPTKTSSTLCDSLRGVLRGFTGDYHINYLPPLQNVREGIREASGAKKNQRVIYTAHNQEFHLNARYMAEAMDALSTGICYYLDSARPVFFCQVDNINANVLEAILPIGTWHQQLPTFVAK